MIYKVGTDIVSVNRISRIYQDYGTVFVRKILTEQEKIYFNKLPKPKKKSYLAKRFAAKEALSKALGGGIGRDFNFNQISVLNTKLGRPFVKYNKNIPALKNFIVDISLADDYPFAIAFVIIQST